MPNLLGSLISSKYADFTIKCGGYTFSVHKVVISSGSEFFDKACSNGFKESEEASATLADDKPELVARMLLHMYTEKYTYDETTQNILQQVRYERFMSVDDPCSTAAKPAFPEVSEFVMAAHMYGMAEKYSVECLKALSRSHFLKLVEEASLSDLFSSVEILYDKLPECDDVLRKWTVWRIQQSKRTVRESATLVELAQQWPDFGRDYLTKYAARNYLWCPDCNNFVDLKNCQCGWSGLCSHGTCSGDGPTRNLQSLHCYLCDSAYGRLLWDKPSDE